MEDLEKVYAEQIAAEYAVKTDTKTQALKKLDKKVKLPPKIFAFTLGIVSSLILGVGMCLCMKVIGDNSTLSFIIGIIVGVIGIILVSINYPMYNKILKVRKDKYAFEITQLAKEISNQ